MDGLGVRGPHQPALLGILMSSLTTDATPKALGFTCIPRLGVIMFKLITVLRTPTLCRSWMPANGKTEGDPQYRQPQRLHQRHGSAIMGTWIRTPGAGTWNT